MEEKYRKGIDKIGEREVFNLINRNLSQSKKIPDSRSSALFEFIKNIPLVWIVSNPNKFKSYAKSASKLLNFAEFDLTSSKLNYNERSFVKAMVDLQQATEKTSKAYGKMFFYLDQDILKKRVIHKSPIVFVEMMKQEWSKHWLELMKGVEPTVKTNSEEIETFFKKSEIEIAKISYDEIRLLLDTLNNLKKLWLNHETVIDNELQKLKKTELIKNNELLTKSLENLKANYINKLLYAYLTMFFVASITYPHYVRYGDEKIELELYNESLGIVRATPEIYPLVENSIKELKEFIGNILN